MEREASRNFWGNIRNPAHEGSPLHHLFTPTFGAGYGDLMPEVAAAVLPPEDHTRGSKSQHIEEAAWKHGCFMTWGTPEANLKHSTSGFLDN